MVALQYLEAALELEHQVQDRGGNPATTRLNICAILSELGHHKEALFHAEQAVIFLEDRLYGYESKDRMVPGSQSKKNLSIMPVAYHNLAVEHEFLRNYDLALSIYQRAAFISERDLGSEHPTTEAIEVSFHKAHDKHQRRMIAEFERRKEAEIRELLTKQIKMEINGHGNSLNAREFSKYPQWPTCASKLGSSKRRASKVSGASLRYNKGRQKKKGNAKKRATSGASNATGTLGILNTQNTQLRNDSQQSYSKTLFIRKDETEPSNQSIDDRALVCAFPSECPIDSPDQKSATTSLLSTIDVHYGETDDGIAENAVFRKSTTPAGIREIEVSHAPKRRYRMSVSPPAMEISKDSQQDTSPIRVESTSPISRSSTSQSVNRNRDEKVYHTLQSMGDALNNLSKRLSIETDDMSHYKDEEGCSGSMESSPPSSTHPCEYSIEKKNSGEEMVSLCAKDEEIELNHVDERDEQQVQEWDPNDDSKSKIDVNELYSCNHNDEDHQSLDESINEDEGQNLFIGFSDDEFECI